MQSAKAAVSSFLNKSGHHDTTVQEEVGPAVTHETVKPTRHENVTTALDKEVHQDHHHTTVVPVTHSEVLPEKHTHQMGQVQHKEFHHGNESDTKTRLQTEAAQFKDERKVVDTKHTQAAAPIQQGEHVHHHVHEHIQPVIHKETHQPEVVHTTIPIHEVHHNAPQHHEASVLPAITMAEFQKSGGSITGRGEKRDAFDGCPKLAVGDKHHHHGVSHTTTSDNVPPTTHQGHHNAATGAAVGTGVGMAAADETIHHRSDSGVGRQRRGSSSSSSADETGMKKHHLRSNKDKMGMGAVGTGAGTVPAAGTGVDQGMDLHRKTNAKDVGHPAGHHGSIGGFGSGATHTTSHTSTKSKPSLMDKLNPKIDADGDGKAGFMS